MKQRLLNLKNLDSESIQGEVESYDLIICSQSIESRCMRVPELVREAKVEKIAYVVPCDNAPILARREKWLKSHGFSIREFSDKDLIDEIQKVRKLKSEGGQINVLLDVTCLPRRIIASIISTLINSCSNNPIDLSVCYTLARYLAPSVSGLEPNKLVAPVHDFFAGWTSRPGLPVTTLVGLGYERGKALGAVEYLQASDWFLFMPDSPETKYRPKVEQHNNQLIEATGKGKVIDYDVTRPLQTLLTIGSVIAGLKSTSKPVLLPFGPKIFFAISLLAAIIHEEAAVWYVSGEENEILIDRPPSSYTTGIKCTIVHIDDNGSSA